MEKRPRIISLNTKFKATKKIREPWYAAFTTGKVITPNEDIWDDNNDVMYFSEYINYRIRSHFLAPNGVWFCEVMNEQGDIIDVSSNSDNYLSSFSIVEE